MVGCSGASESQLLPIFMLLEKRQFKLAEKTLLKLLKNLVKATDNPTEHSDLLGLTQTLYSNFNRNYLIWMKKRGKDVRKEITTLHSDSHDNLLLAHCTDSAYVDDLFYEALRLSSQGASPRQNREISQRISLYHRLIRS